VTILTDEELVRPSNFYSRRSDELHVAAGESAARYSRFTQFLVVLGLLACVAFYQSVFVKRLPLWAAMLVIPAGAVVVQQRHRWHLRSVQLGSLIDYYDKGAARLAQKWDLLDGGDRFIDEDHFYSKDLDLFGRGSLYQLICSARTHIARETLAHWMKAPAKLEEIHARHQAILELRPRRELPELLAAAGPMQASDFRPEFFQAWVAEGSSSFPIGAPLVAFLLALAVIISPILYWSGFLGLQALWDTLGTLLFAESIFAVTFRGRVKSVLESLGTLSIELPTMRELLQIIEREQFSASKLKSLANHLGEEGPAASGHIRHLLRLIRLVEQRKNEWFAYPSFCLLWGTQFAMAIEKVAPPSRRPNA
jgi:hypothetical protein